MNGETQPEPITQPKTRSKIFSSKLHSVEKIPTHDLFLKIPLLDVFFL